MEQIAIHQACSDVSGLRQRVAQQLNIPVGDGCFWLPVVLTAKGPLYGEVIGLSEALSVPELPKGLKSSNSAYCQPLHICDEQRQQLYQLGYQLLKLLSAPPATYLVQFGLQELICFDRLWSFPTAPASASLGVQQPDLFTCHWHCLTGLPVLDLTIVPSAT